MNYKKTLGNKYEYLCLLIVKCDQYNFKYSYSKKSQEGGTGVCVLSIWSKNGNNMNFPPVMSKMIKMTDTLN